MKTHLRTAVFIAAAIFAVHASAQIIFYENEAFQGRSFNTNVQVRNFKSVGFNDQASSVVVLHDRWEVCEDAGYSGRCVFLRPGRYANLNSMGLDKRISSVRTVSNNVRPDDERYAPPAEPVYDNRRRNDERLYEADVTSVRAVVGPPEQRCWVERDQIPQAQQRSGPNVPGAVVGALLGGILGHQFGGGSGKDLATVGGAVAGGAVGAQVGRGGNPQPPATHDVQHCTSVPSQAKPALWDVSYTFRGQEHRMQMTTPPGQTVTVNRQGEPRS